MTGPKLVTHRSLFSVRRAGPAVLMLLVLLLSPGVTSLAQDEDLNSKAPEKMPDPTVVSQEVLPNGALQTQVTIPVTQDTYISSNQPDTNWCGSNWLRVGYDIDESKGAERIFLSVNLSSIPSNATINWATFEIYQHTVTPAGDPNSMGIQVRHLVSSWDQCAVTWNSHEPDWGDVAETVYIPNTIGWISVDATTRVTEVVSGQRANNGLILIGDERVQERERGYYSTRDLSRYPRLVVNYTAFADNQPPQVSVEPLPQWSKQSFTVEWGGTDPGGSGIAHYDVQYRVNGGGWIDWISQTTATSATFVGSEPNKYEFQARGVDRVGNVQPYPNTPQAGTTVDWTPPSATVEPLPQYTFQVPFTVQWTGSDNLAGIKCYDIQYRVLGGDWIQAITCTTASSTQVSGAEDGKTYQLRARATDNAGNVEPWPDNPQAQTTMSTSGPVSWVKPFASPITQANQITVQWQASTSPGTNIKNYDVQYCFNNGAWISWLQNTTLESDVFTDLRPNDGGYCFQARATDSENRTGNWSGSQCIYVDRNAPFMTNKFFLPISDLNAYE